MPRSAFIFALGLLLAGAVRGQEAPPHGAEAEAHMALAFAEGVRAVEGADYGRAIPRLIRLYHVDSTYVSADLGSLAYWLGHAFARTGQAETAAVAWERGFVALAAQGRIDLRLADAFVDHVFARRDSARYAIAARAYLALLSQLEGVVPPALEPLRRRHLGPLALILPEDVRAATGLTRLEARLDVGAAPALAAWWRRADVLPATPANERLYEHLERLAHARQHYTAAGPLGFDDRGRIYVRFGAPTREATITFTDVQGADAFDALDLVFPDNAFWVYRDVHERAHYLFVRTETGAYRLGLPHDLVPPAIRNHRRRTATLLAALERIYRELAVWYPQGHYGLYYDRLAGDRLKREQGVADASMLPAWAFAQQTLHTLQGEDARAAKRRDAAVPDAVSGAFAPAEPLAVAVRPARFLDPDGTTRTEVYWGMAARALQPSRRRSRALRKAGFEPAPNYLLDLTVAQQDAAFRTRLRTARRHVLQGATDDEAAVVPPQAAVVRGDTARYHLALQFDAYWYAPESAAAAVPGPRLKVASIRLDSLHALSADPARLEMSDLKPLSVSPGTALEDAPPYPHARLTPATPLGLYFEVYHLAFGPDDRTHYTVAYTVEQEGQRGFLGRTKTATLARARTAYTGDARTAREYVALDLGRLGDGGAVTVRVTVTDETTGRVVERALRFAPPLPPAR